MNYELMENNKVFLMGKVVSAPEFSHEVFGEGFYELYLSVKRLSDHNDIIPITISERLLNDKDFNIGNTIAIKGQFRSYNKLVDDKSKLMLTVFARDIMPFDDTINPNTLKLNGYICKPPVYRKTPFNREICDVLIAVNRQYGKSDYIPCIVWGRNARFAQNLSVGEHICVSGRVQSRTYQKKLSEENVVTRTAYEVSVNKIDVVDDSILPTPADTVV